ncbi:MAG: serine/threonine protein kinase [Clostridia bacterium]|nr:serine/threonine protein kinase [Clostridia bacterium]
MEWIDQVLQQEYQTIAVLKQTPTKQIVRLRHNRLNTDLICRRFTGKCDVYKLLLGVEHPNLPKVYEAVCRDDNCIVLEEYIDGITVHDILQGDLYSVNGAKSVGLAVCDALSVLHSLGIIHRDIKPENIMVTNQGQVVLMDLDAARIYKPMQAGDTAILGTVQYAAPEQFGVGQSDARTDIFAMGVLLNVLLTGVHPSSDMAKGKIKKIVEKCIQMEPSKRYQTAAQLKNALLKL